VAHRVDGTDAGVDPGGPYPPPPHVRYRSPSGEAAPVVDITPAPEWAQHLPATGVTPRNGAGTAALVLGCLAFVCTTGLFVLFPVGILFGLLAVLLGRRARDRASWGGSTNRASATAGLTLGALSLFLGTVLTAATAWFVQSYDVDAMRSCISDRPTLVTAGHCILDVVDRA
jgi:hypothetical protein